MRKEAHLYIKGRKGDILAKLLEVVKDPNETEERKFKAAVCYYLAWGGKEIPPRSRDER